MKHSTDTKQHELEFILSSIKNEPKNNCLDLFNRIYESEQKLANFYENEEIRKKFKLTPPTFSDSVTFGLYSLYKTQKENHSRQGQLGGNARKQKYKPCFDFVKSEYSSLIENRKNISDRYAAEIIYEKLFDTYKKCPLTPSNGEETVRKWISKIRKEACSFEN